MRAPATTSIAKAMAQKLIAVPMSGSIRIRKASAPVTTRKGTRPCAVRDPRRRPGDRLGDPEGEGELGELRGLQLAEAAQRDPAPRRR